LAPIDAEAFAEVVAADEGADHLGDHALGQARAQPADQAILAKILVALGTIALQQEAIRAIDLNPVKIRPDGSLVAVDALISLSSTVAAKR